ncbi:DNA-processing protein DprA [Lapidilactobacillus luobeiensis]|uniref:DNA-processing protein DprA n=1 Tax=Lapidilactobacillus luobeiensis TaxID=2950371 RepID=UPI0021C2D992|nr:DNA-processing protein DprA [Lapidilactobacillus luobeiensis]
MEKEAVLLAASTQAKWRYRDQLWLALWLRTVAAAEIATWDWLRLDRCLLASWPQRPERLQATPRPQTPFLTILDQVYPQGLAEIYRPPLILYYQGNLELLATPKLAIVGARACTNYTQYCLRRLIPPLVQNQITIVSGLAAGADQLAHQETLLAHGQTIAVIGTGLDVYYPPANRSLQQLIGQKGLLLSEYPLGTAPRRYHFPQRNRIIAGLSQGVLVTEAQHHSGSLITANLALQENRNVYALPGNILQETSVGTNELLAAGATPVLTAADLLVDFQDRRAK